MIITYQVGIRYPDELLRRNYSRLVPDSLSNYRYYIYSNDNYLVSQDSLSN